MLVARNHASSTQSGALMSTGFVIPKPQGNSPTIRPYVEALRQVRGFHMAINSRRSVIVSPLSDGTVAYSVPSETEPGVIYTVAISPVNVATCAGCPDFAKNGNDACKHIIEVLYRYFGETVIPHPSPEALRVTGNHKTWYDGARREKHVPIEFASGLAESTRFDRANEAEDDRVRRLSASIAEILNNRFRVPVSIDSRGRKRGGRPTLPYGDRVHYEIVRDQARKSARKFKKTAAELTQEGELEFSPCRNSTSKYAADEQMIPVRRSAFWMTIYPFLHLEEDVIIDSTGFSSFQVSCWLDSDYGVGPAQRSGTKWFKMHIAIGRISKAILGFAITENTGSESSDTVQFEPLLRGLKEAGFKMRYVVADNIYLTEEAIATTKRYGAELLGPLKPRNYNKKGIVNPGVAPIWQFKKNHPELYDALCKARQPIEAVFSVMKRRANRTNNIGTAVERQALREGTGGMVFHSRQSEFMTRIIRYNLSVINRHEHLRDQEMTLSLAAPAFFGPIENAKMPVSPINSALTAA